MEQIKVEMKPQGLQMECDKNEFALALKTWRLRQGLTQKETGQKFGCSRYTIMRAENAKQVTWEMAYRLFAKLAYELRKEVQDEK
jgi:transcriptional regulator with XRE-family HTH domain